jgi:predicted RNase H-like nuclease (RuvC/YqgF family)
MKYADGVPVVAAVIASLYGGLSYVNSLQNTIEDNEKTIIELSMGQDNNWQNLNDRIASETEKLNIRITNNSEQLKSGREELLIEMTNFATEIARIQILAETLRDAQYKLASEAELRAMEQSYYKLNDALNQMKYDLKEMQRQLNGGY